MAYLGREFAAHDSETPNVACSPDATSGDHALVIGVNDYPHVRPLRGAIADARAFADWLLDGRGGGLPAENVRMILSAPSPLGPMVDEINTALEKVLVQAERTGGRRFYFYFSGHGCVGDKATDLALCLANWSHLRRRAALSSEAWLDVVVRSGIFDEVAFFFDCCRVWATRAVGLPPEIDYVGWSVRRARGTRVFLAYATEFQRAAMESPTDDNKSPEIRGIFTRVLIEALNGGAASPDDGVTAESLKKYLERVTETQASASGFCQRAEVLNGLEQGARFGELATKSTEAGLAIEPSTDRIHVPRSFLEILPESSPEKGDLVAWIASYIRHQITMGFEVHRAPGEVASASSRLLMVILPGQSPLRASTQRAAHGWSISCHGRTINLTATLPRNPNPDTPFVFTALLNPGAYVLCNEGAISREISVHLYQNWTTVVAIDDIFDPHFENARVFLHNGISEDILSFNEFDFNVAHGLAELHTRAHGTFVATAEGPATDTMNPMHALITGHLLARQNDPDSRRIEAIANNVESMLGPCSDVQALRLRAALICGQDLTPMIGTDPPMLREGLVAFVEASHHMPELIPAGSLLEHACIERLVDSPLSSWPARPKNATGDDWLTTAIEDLATQHGGATESMDLTTIAHELGVPTRAVTTRIAITRERTRTKKVVGESSAQTHVPLVTIPPRSSADEQYVLARLIGTKLADRYIILSLLGEGGIGAVFLADDTATGTKVAIKLLKADSVDDPVIIARFEREAQIMTELNHENIVRASAFGRSPEGDLCLVLEYVHGETLRTLLKRAKPFPAQGTLDISQQVTTALTYAHRLGIVHRDLKPENIMVTWRDQNRPSIKILDFGIARLLTNTTAQLTRKGAIFGTPEYMPPEQAMGQPVDGRADQYAFGVMIYEMITGERPFNGKSALEISMQQIRQNPPSLTEKVPGTPPKVAAAVAKMLAKKADDRFPDMQSAYQALFEGYHPQAPGCT